MAQILLFGAIKYMIVTECLQQLILPFMHSFNFTMILCADDLIPAGCTQCSKLDAAHRKHFRDLTEDADRVFGST